jgi:hypothetical protein
VLPDPNAYPVSSKPVLGGSVLRTLAVPCSTQPILVTNTDEVTDVMEGLNLNIEMGW